MMTHQTLRTIRLAAALVVAVSCNQRQDARSPGPDTASVATPNKLKDDSQDTAANLREQKQRLQNSLAGKLAAFEREWSDLKEKSVQTGEKVRQTWTRKFTELQVKKQTAADKLEQLKNSSTDKWQEVRTGAQAAFSDLEKAFKNAFDTTRDDSHPGKP